MQLIDKRFSNPELITVPDNPWWRMCHDHPVYRDRLHLNFRPVWQVWDNPICRWATENQWPQLYGNYSDEKSS